MKKKILAKNKKAFFNYEILADFEAGIKLMGSEVKSCRLSNINLKGSYVTPRNEELWLENVHISQYKFANQNNHDPFRKRKLLLNRKEINKILAESSTPGITIVPLEMYLKHGLVKVKIGICRGKKQHDKRHDLKQKAQKMEIKRALKRFA